MSFSSEQKEILLTQTVKNSCCRRNMMYGMLCAKGKLVEETVVLHLDSILVPLGKRLIHEYFGRDATRSSSQIGGRGSDLVFQNHSAAALLSDILVNQALTPPIKCGMCFSCFLQGIFLACGRIADPKKQYCLEFSLADRSEWFAKAFEDAGLYPKISRKENETLLYFKKSSDIEDFFAMAGMNQTAFYVMNTKITGELRNNANRVANCETNNIGKAVNASNRQLLAIERLDKANLLSSLPEELEKTARLRLEHRDLSLSQLATVSIPPISKSGLSHRMERIMSACEALLAKVSEE